LRVCLGCFKTIKQELGFSLNGLALAQQRSGSIGQSVSFCHGRAVSEQENHAPLQKETGLPQPLKSMGLVFGVLEGTLFAVPVVFRDRS
jgi:hypothetical protein